MKNKIFSFVILHLLMFLNVNAYADLGHGVGHRSYGRSYSFWRSHSYCGGGRYTSSHGGY